MWFNETVYHNIHGPSFEEFFVISREDRYDIMCGLHDYDKDKENSTGTTYLHGGHPLPEDSNVNPLIYLCVTITFIGSCSNTLDRNIE